MNLPNEYIQYVGVTMCVYMPECTCLFVYTVAVYVPVRSLSLAVSLSLRERTNPGPHGSRCHRHKQATDCLRVSSQLPSPGPGLGQAEEGREVINDGPQPWARLNVFCLSPATKQSMVVFIRASKYCSKNLNVEKCFA